MRGKGKKGEREGRNQGEAKTDLGEAGLKQLRIGKERKEEHGREGRRGAREGEEKEGRFRSVSTYLA